MNSQYQFNFANVLQDPIDDYDDIQVNTRYVSDRRQFTEKETFCAILGRHTDSKDDFSQLVHLFSEVNTMNLIGQLKPAINEIDDYYNTSLQFKGITNEDLERMTSSTRQRRENNTFAGAKKVVWDAGLPAMNIGDDPFNVSHSEHSHLMEESLSDMDNVIEHAVFSKQNSMVNSYKSIIKTIPTKDRSALNSDLSRQKAVDAMIADFDEGKMRYRLSPEQYSSPREPGVSLPHTLSPREWVVTTTSHLVGHLYGDDFLLCVRDKDMQDVRICRGGPGDYFTFDEDPNSPFYLDVSPSLYCNEIDDDGTWEWRNASEIIKIRVNQEMASQGIPSQNSQQREQILKRKQREVAEDLKGNTPDIISDLIGFPYLRMIRESSFGVSSKKKFMLLLYKAGLSKLDEAYEHSDYVHLVSKENASSIGDTKYYKILYPDMNTVLLLPIDFWSRSKWAVSKQTCNKPYISAYGLKLPRLDFSAVGLYFALFQLSHTKCMIDSWKQGKAYDPAEHTHKLSAVFGNVQDDNFKTLFPSGFGGRNFEIISTHLNIFINMFPGSVSGLWIAPALSKQGKTSIKSMQRNAGYARELDSYDPKLKLSLNNNHEPFADLFTSSSFVSSPVLVDVESDDSIKSEKQLSSDAELSIEDLDSHDYLDYDSNDQ